MTPVAIRLDMSLPLNVSHPILKFYDHEYKMNNDRKFTLSSIRFQQHLATINLKNHVFDVILKAAKLFWTLWITFYANSLLTISVINGRGFPFQDWKTPTFFSQTLNHSFIRWMFCLFGNCWVGSEEHGPTANDGSRPTYTSACPTWIFLSCI